MRFTAVLVALAAIGASMFASASTIEDLTSVCYQWDGNTDCDASDDCAMPDPFLTQGEWVSGMLVSVVDETLPAVGRVIVDDVEDNYGFVTSGGSHVVLFNASPAVDPDSLPFPAFVVEVWGPSGGVACSNLLGSGSSGGLGLGATAAHDPGVPEIRIEFEVFEPGVHTIRILSRDPIKGPMFSCHPFCVGTVASIAGYDVVVN